MVIFGLILLLLAVAVIVYMWLATTGMTPIDIDYGILNVSLTPFWLFVAGGVALAAATSGLWLLGVGTRSKARKSKEMRELRRQAKEADRRAERASDSASLDRAPATDRATSTGRTTSPGRTTTTTAPAGATRTPGTDPASSSEGPILPRTPRNDGPTEGPSSLDIDRPRG